MPPPKTIIVDRDQVLNAIKLAAQTDAKYFAARVYILRFAKGSRDIAETCLRRAQDGWTVYDLELFSGRDDLSASEKQVWRAEIRRMESEEILQRCGREIRVNTNGQLL